MTFPAGPAKARVWMVLAVAGILLFAVYALTAARTCTWWEGSSWSLVAATLGVAGAPGSLILTLLGWIVTRIPLGLSTAFQLNLFSALVRVAMLGMLAAVVLLTDPPT